MKSLTKEGFEIHREVIHAELLSRLRREAERLSSENGTACVRGIRERSALFDQLAFDPAIAELVPRGYEPVRSLLFDKTAEENWPVLWHQDLTIAVEKQEPIEGYGPWSVNK